jgi:nitroreductase
VTQQPDAAFAGEWAETLIHGRRTVLPKRLAEPGPDAAQLQRILGAAAAAPDHHDLVPWRFVLVPSPARGALGEAFAASLRERDAEATEAQLEEARTKAYRSPVLMLAVARTSGGDPEISASERLVSAGCAIQNMLLMATALGFGSSLTSGKALRSQRLHALFALQPGEEPLCFISIGTIAGAKRARVRPTLERYVSELKP